MAYKALYGRKKNWHRHIQAISKVSPAPSIVFPEHPDSPHWAISCTESWQLCKTKAPFPPSSGLFIFPNIYYLCFIWYRQLFAKSVFCLVKSTSRSCPQAADLAITEGRQFRLDTSFLLPKCKGVGSRLRHSTSKPLKLLRLQAESKYAPCEIRWAVHRSEMSLPSTRQNSAFAQPENKFTRKQALNFVGFAQVYANVIFG